ncbi:MAG: mRNA interferase RelE/StbE [Pseudonocardiales bacterium]|nr:mRNA interferase RelE/StbE [Pseudonocardiales bacterium]
MTPTPFEVTFSASAQRDLRRLPEKVATAAVEFIYSGLAENPRRVGRELQLDLADHYSARRGDHRIIYRIDDDAHAILVVTVDHRADSYRSRQRAR